jgi:hypothetical protein
LQDVLQKHAATLFTVIVSLNGSEWGCSSTMGERLRVRLQFDYDRTAQSEAAVRLWPNGSEWGCSSTKALQATYIVITFFVIVDEVLFPAQNNNITRK